MTRPFTEGMSFSVPLKSTVKEGGLQDGQRDGRDPTPAHSPFPSSHISFSSFSFLDLPPRSQTDTVGT